MLEILRINCIFKPSGIIVFNCIVFFLLLADLKSAIPNLCPPVSLPFRPESGKYIYELDKNKTTKTIPSCPPAKKKKKQ